MKAFRDTNGVEWRVALSIGAAKRVKDLLAVNLLDLASGDPPLVTRLATDDELRCNVVYAIVKPQADAAGIDDQKFGEALGGETIAGLTQAFFDELQDFFQKSGRPEISRLVARQNRLIADVQAGIGKRIEDPRFDRIVERELAKLDATLGEAFGSLPDTSG